MSTKEAEKLYEDVFIHKYEADFKENTGKDLQLTIINRQIGEKYCSNTVLPVDRILSIVNSMIPNYENNPDLTIVKQGKKRDLWELRQIFTKICIDMGYDRNVIIKTINVNHTTIVYYLQQIEEILIRPRNYIQQVDLYYATLNKIKESYERPVQPDYQSEFNTQSNIPALLHERQGSTAAY